MAMKHTWSIVDLERVADVGVVSKAHWKLTTEDGDVRVVETGVVSLPPKEPVDPAFIPYETLTEEVVVGWVHDALSQTAVQTIEALAAKRVEAVRAPTVLSGVPWVQG